MQAMVQRRPDLVRPQTCGAESRHGLLSPGELGLLPQALREKVPQEPVALGGRGGRTKGRESKGSCRALSGDLCVFAPGSFWPLLAGRQQSASALPTGAAPCRGPETAAWVLAGEGRSWVLPGRATGRFKFTHSVNISCASVYRVRLSSDEYVCISGKSKSVDTRVSHAVQQRGV